MTGHAVDCPLTVSGRLCRFVCVGSVPASLWWNRWLILADTVG